MIFLIYLPAYILFIIVFYLMSKNIQKNIIEVSFLLGIGYFILLPLTAYLLNNGYSIVSPFANSSWSYHMNTILDIETNFNLSILIILNTLAIFFTHFIRFSKTPPVEANLIKTKTLILLMFFCVMPILILELLVPSNIVHWYERASYINQHFGLLGVLSKYVYVSMRIIILIILIHNFRINKKYFFLVLLMSLAFVDMYVTGNRIFLIISIFTILFELMLLKKYKLILFSSMFMIPVIAFLIAWSQIRSLMSNLSLWESITISFDVFKEINFTKLIFQITEGADFLILLSIVRDFGVSFSYIMGDSFIKLFVFFVPRYVYSDKPDSIALTIGKIYQPETSGLALNTTFLGEQFANFGLSGFIMMVFVILFLKYLKYVTDKFISIYMLPYFFVFPFLISRANTSDMLIQAIICLIILIILSKKVVIR